MPRVLCLVARCLVVCSVGGGKTGAPLPTKSSGFVSDDREYFGGRGIARLPFSSQPRGGLPRRLRVLRRIGTFTLLLTLTWCSSEEGQPLPHISGMYFGGGGTGPPPHNVGELTDDECHFVSRREWKHVPASECESQTPIALGNARRCALCQW